MQNADLNSIKNRYRLTKEPVYTRSNFTKLNTYKDLINISLIQTSDSSLKNSWAAYGPGNSNHLEIILTELKDP